MGTPTLEGLPVELLILILLQTSDRDTLRSLVLSSSACHGAYLRAREEILGCILRRQYDGLLKLSEGIAAIRSKNLHMLDNTEEAIALLDSWRRSEEINALALTSGPLPNEPASLDEIIELFQLHREVNFFLEDYSIHALRPPWISPHQWLVEFMPLRLSYMEKRRFARALCRLYLHANIFGNIEITESRTDRISNDWENAILGTQEAWRLFFGTLPPWEYEELECVSSYLMARYEPVVREISRSLKDRGVYSFWDLPEDGRPPDLSMTIDAVDHLEQFPGCIDSLLSLGPGFLFRILNATARKRRDMVLMNASCFLRTWIGTDIGMPWDQKLPLLYPADRYNVQTFEELWSLTTPNDGPNTAWKRLRLEDARKGASFEAAFVGFGAFNCKEAEWEWGYAIWDEERLKEWKAPLLNRGYHTSVD